jgi:hypothetical protein
LTPSPPHGFFPLPNRFNYSRFILNSDTINWLFNLFFSKLPSVDSKLWNFGKPNLKLVDVDANAEEF